MDVLKEIYWVEESWSGLQERVDGDGSNRRDEHGVCSVKGSCVNRR